MVDCRNIFLGLVCARSRPVLIAMSDAGSAASQCPVLSAWAESQIVLQRLSTKNVLVLSNDSKLTRYTCTANKALLVPLINLVGSSTAIISASLHCMLGNYNLCVCCYIIIRPGMRPSVDLVASYLQRLYAGFRPIHCKIPDRLLDMNYYCNMCHAIAQS